MGGGPRAPSSALPIGAVASAPDPLRVTHMPVTGELTQSLLAVSHAETPEQVLTSNVAGFILVGCAFVAACHWSVSQANRQDAIEVFKT